MQSDPAVVEAEGERAGSPFPATVRRGRSQRGRGAAVVPRPRLQPPIKAAIFLSIRGLSGGVGTQRHPARTGEKGRLLLPQSYWSPVVLLDFLVLPAKPSRCSVELWSQLPAARYSLLSPLPLKFPGAVVVLFVLGGHHFQFAFKLLLLWLLLLGLLSVLASALGLLAERFWICRHCWFSRGRR